MQLIKINQDHYVVVTDEPIKEGDWIYWNKKLVLAIGTSYNSDTKKVTHSTSNVGGFSSLLEAGIKEIDLPYIKSLVGEVDVEEKSKEHYIKHSVKDDRLSLDEQIQRSGGFKVGFKEGYNQCLEDNKDKRFSEEDMRKAIFMAREDEHKIDVRHPNEIISSLTQPKDTWEVEFDSNNNLKLK